MYDHQQLDLTIAPIASALDDAGTFEIPVGSQPVVVRALWATVHTQFATDPTVLTFKYRPTPGSDSGATTLGTITLPISATAGKQLYKNVDPFKCMPGGTIAVTSGGESSDGAGGAGVRVTPSWENPENNSNAIASA